MTTTEIAKTKATQDEIEKTWTSVSRVKSQAEIDEQKEQEA